MSLEVTITVTAATPPPLWVHLEDHELDLWDGRPRPCAYSPGCPAVFVLLEPALKVALTRAWQFYIRAINPGMTPAKVAAIFGWYRAFCNGTGLGDESDPRANFLEGTHLSSPLPQFDKDRTCARSVMTGTPAYSLRAAFADVVTAATQHRSFLALRQALTGTNTLQLVTFDGNQPPPLKPGRTYPKRLEDIRLDDYLYNPREHRWMFFCANNIRARDGSSTLFPFDERGGVYEWTGDPRPTVWLPHVSRHPVAYPLARLRPLAAGEPLPSPYRS